MRDDLFRLNDTKEHDPRVVAWFDDLGDSPRQMVKPWFARLRICGDDVREVLHDGCPTACVGDVAFGYVNAFMGHAALGFFQGASLPDPKGLLEGTGKRMRHVKLRPGVEENMMAMTALIDAAYEDIKRRIASRSQERTTMTIKKAATKAADSPAKLIDGRIKELGDWRGETLALVRKLIREACPGVEETWKWRGVPVFERDGIICTGETYKAVVKLTFANGAALADPKGLFNSSLEGNVRRAIDIREGEKIDAPALKALVRTAADFNAAKRAGKKKQSSEVRFKLQIRSRS